MLVTELPDGIGEGHYFFHFSDRCIEFVLIEHVEGVREQEDPVPQAFPVNIDPAALDGNDDPVVTHYEKL